MCKHTINNNLKPTVQCQYMLINWFASCTFPAYSIFSNMDPDGHFKGPKVNTQFDAMYTQNIHFLRICGPIQNKLRKIIVDLNNLPQRSFNYHTKYKQELVNYKLEPLHLQMAMNVLCISLPGQQDISDHRNL